jgi:acetyl-CoA synthetase
MTEHKAHSATPEIFPVPANIAKNAKITAERYAAMYEASIENPEKFWAEHGRRLTWSKPYTQVKDVDYNDNARIR